MLRTPEAALLWQDFSTQRAQRLSAKARKEGFLEGIIYLA
jgi:hypothetical protein